MLSSHGAARALAVETATRSEVAAAMNFMVDIVRIRIAVGEKESLFQIASHAVGNEEHWTPFCRAK